MSKEETQHPSYGMVSISRVSGNTNLNGSNIQHQHFFRLTVNTAKKSEDAYSTCWYSDDRIVELSLSGNQLIDMFTQMNTQGIPCTLNWVKGEGCIEQPPTEHLRKKLQDDITTTINKMGSNITSLSERIETLLAKKGTLTKADKEEITSLTHRIKQDYNSNLPFLHKCQEEHMEKVITQVGSEVENNIAQIIRSTGIEGIEKLIKSNIKLIGDD